MESELQPPLLNPLRRIQYDESFTEESINHIVLNFCEWQERIYEILALKERQLRQMYTQLVKSF